MVVAVVVAGSSSGKKLTNAIWLNTLSPGVTKRDAHSLMLTAELKSLLVVVVVVVVLLAPWPRHRPKLKDVRGCAEDLTGDEDSNSAIGGVVTPSA